MSGTENKVLEKPHYHGHWNGTRRCKWKNCPRRKHDLRAWAVEWHSRNWLDGETRTLIWNPDDRFHLFSTRSECRAFIESKYGYIRQRSDLRTEPHGWFIPRAVRVVVNREQ